MPRDGVEQRVVQLGLRDARARVLLAEGGHERQHDIDEGGARRGHGHVREPTGGERAGRLLRPSMGDEDLARHREERLAGRRQLEPAGDPGEQGQAQLTLKPLQLPTERGLHEIQADRGPRDRADLGHRDEGPEQFLLHAG